MNQGMRFLVMAADQEGLQAGWRRIILTSSDDKPNFQCYIDLDPEECWAVAQSLLKPPGDPDAPKVDEINGL